MRVVYHGEIVWDSGQIIYFSTFWGKFGQSCPVRGVGEEKRGLRTGQEDYVNVNAARQEAAMTQAAATRESLRQPFRETFAARAPENFSRQVQIAARRLPTGIRSREPESFRLQERSQSTGRFHKEAAKKSRGSPCQPCGDMSFQRLKNSSAALTIFINYPCQLLYSAAYRFHADGEACRYRDSMHRFRAEAPVFHRRADSQPGRTSVCSFRRCRCFLRHKK